MERAIKTEIGKRKELKGVGKLGWLMSLTVVAVAELFNNAPCSGSSVLRVQILIQTEPFPPPPHTHNTHEISVLLAC